MYKKHTLTKNVLVCADEKLCKLKARYHGTLVETISIFECIWLPNKHRVQRGYIFHVDKFYAPVYSTDEKYTNG